MEKYKLVLREDVNIEAMMLDDVKKQKEIWCLIQEATKSDIRIESFFEELSLSLIYNGTLPYISYRIILRQLIEPYLREYKYAEEFFAVLGLTKGYDNDEGITKRSTKFLDDYSESHLNLSSTDSVKYRARQGNKLFCEGFFNDIKKNCRKLNSIRVDLGRPLPPVDTSRLRSKKNFTKQNHPELANEKKFEDSKHGGIKKGHGDTVEEKKSSNNTVSANSLSKEMICAQNINVFLFHFGFDNTYILRKSLLEKISDCFNRSPDPITTLLVYGLPGMGKTELIKRYICNNHTNYNSVFWVGSRKKDAYSHLKAVGFVSPRDFLIALSRMMNWCVVFDNVTDYLEIEEYIPKTTQCGIGHVIIISRQKFEEISNRLPVLPFDEYEAERFYRTSLKNSKDKIPLKKIKLLTGFHPASLFSVIDFLLSEIQENKEEILDNPELLPAILDGVSGQKYSHSVLSEFQQYREDIKKISRSTYGFLNIFAYLPPMNLCLPFWEKMQKRYTSIFSDLHISELDEVKTTLDKYAFCPSIDTQNFYRLFQKCTIFNHKQTGDGIWIISCYNLVKKYMYDYGADDFETLQRFGSLGVTVAMHARTILKLEDSIDIANMFIFYGFPNVSNLDIKRENGLLEQDILHFWMGMEIYSTKKEDSVEGAKAFYLASELCTKLNNEYGATTWMERASESGWSDSYLNDYDLFSAAHKTLSTP